MNAAFHKRIGLDLKTVMDRATCLLLFALMIFLPLFKAGMMPGSLSVILMCSLAILIYGLFVKSEKNRYWILVWGVFSFVTLIHLFIIPGSIGFTHILDPFQPLDILDNMPVNFTQGLGVWAFFTTMWVVAWRVSLLSLKQVEWMLLVVFFVSLFQAMFGLIHYLNFDVSDIATHSVMGLWDKQHYLGDATGTFVNRNHFSGMLAICWPLVLCGLLAERPLLLARLSVFARAMIAVFYSLTVVVAILSSHSRMGLAAAFFGLFVWALLLIKTHSRSDRHSLSRFMPWAFGLGLLVFAIWFGVVEILERYTALSNGDSRILIWRAMFDLPLFAWVVGVGPGAFEDVFNLVKPEFLGTRFVYAHNDYLEFVLEMGLVFSAFIAVAFYFWAKSLFVKGDYVLRAGALGSLAVVALHSLVDFNLQIPGSALYFWLAVGLMMNFEIAQNDLVAVDEKGSGNSKKKRRKRVQDVRSSMSKSDLLRSLRSG